MVTYALGALLALAMMLPLMWAVPDMVAEAVPVDEAAPVVLVARHRRSLRRRWWTVDMRTYWDAVLSA